jgi:hypothetical protein
MAATAVTLPSSGTPFPVATTASSSSARRCLLLPSAPPRRALRVVASAATEAPPKATPPPTSPSGIVLVDPSEAQRVHRLKAVYDQKVVPLITEEFGYTNVHQVLDPAPRRRKGLPFLLVARLIRWRGWILTFEVCGWFERLGSQDREDCGELRAGCGCR